MSEPGNRILVVTGKEDGLRGRALQTAVTRRALQPKHCTTQRLYREHKIELTASPCSAKETWGQIDFYGNIILDDRDVDICSAF